MRLVYLTLPAQHTSPNDDNGGEKENQRLPVFKKKKLDKPYEIFHSHREVQSSGMNKNPDG